MENSKDISSELFPECIAIMCRIFWGPDPVQCEKLINGKLFSAFNNPVLEPGVNFGASLAKLDTITGSFPDTVSLCTALNEEYVKLFVTNRDGIEAPLFESCYEYQNAQLMGPAAIRMKNLFETSGLTLSIGTGEPPDHLSIELEYLYFLTTSRDACGRLNQAKKAHDFAEGVMIPWVNLFHDRLVQKYPDSFYTVSANILLRLLYLIRDAVTVDG